MASFHDVRFPEWVEQGARGGPSFNTAIAETSGGYEYRQANWSMPRYKFNVASGLKSPADYATLLAFFNARMGRLYSFRFKDWSDFTAPAGSPVVAIPGTSPVQYRLAKAYTSGPVTYLRPISKPVNGTLTLSGGGVDYTTGIVSGGSGVTWSGEFDVCVRFDSDDFLLTLEELTIGHATEINVVEVRE